MREAEVGDEAFAVEADSGMALAHPEQEENGPEAGLEADRELHAVHSRGGGVHHRR